MNTTEDSPQRLVLQDQTAWIAMLCFGAALFMAVLSLKQGHGLGSILVPAALFAVFGIAFLSTARIVFDRDRRSIEIRRFTSFRSIRQTLGFDEVKDVEIQQSTGRRTPMCRLALVTASGSVPLTNVYGPNLAHYEAMRIAILRALGLSAAVTAPRDQVRALVRQGQLIEAIKLLRDQEGLDLATAKARVDAMEKELG